MDDVNEALLTRIAVLEDKLERALWVAESYEMEMGLAHDQCDELRLQLDELIERWDEPIFGKTVRACA